MVIINKIDRLVIILSLGECDTLVIGVFWGDSYGILIKEFLYDKLGCEWYHTEKSTIIVHPPKKSVLEKEITTA